MLERKRREPPPVGKMAAAQEDIHAEQISSPTATAASAQAGVVCAHCGVTLQPSSRRPRRFCSARCRQASFREFRNSRGDQSSDPASAAPALPLRLSDGQTVNYVDVLGGHHRGHLDDDLRRLILAVEIGSAA